MLVVVRVIERIKTRVIYRPDRHFAAPLPLWFGNPGPPERPTRVHGMKRSTTFGTRFCQNAEVPHRPQHAPGGDPTRQGCPPASSRRPRILVLVRPSPLPRELSAKTSKIGSGAKMRTKSSRGTCCCEFARSIASNLASIPICTCLPLF